MNKKKKNYKSLIISLSILTAISILSASTNTYANSGYSNSSVPNSNKTQIKTSSYSEKLKQLEYYQAKYWQTVKSNNILFTNGDKKVLNDLFTSARNNVDKNNQYYKQLVIIENQFKNINKDNPLVSDYHNKTDKLLNDVYKEIKLTTPEADFYNLKLSERKWLKDIENYKTNIINKGISSADSKKMTYAIANMKHFRTLLLISYLKTGNNFQSNIPTLQDYLGNWEEPIAGRQNINIKDKGSYIQIIHEGANSAFSYSKDIYKCNYNNQTGTIICRNREHNTIEASCNGYSPYEEGYFKCEQKTPNLLTEKTIKYTETKQTIFSLKKGNNNYHIVNDDKDLWNKNEVIKNYKNKVLLFRTDEVNNRFYQEK